VEVNAMTIERDINNQIEDLRRKAEAQIAAFEGGTNLEVDATSQRLLHDLHVHQIELEMQNEELRGAQHEIEQSRDRYLDLYNHAPVGYVVTDSVGMILQSNQTFGHMLDEDVSGLLRQPLTRMIHTDDQGIFFSRFKAFYKNPVDKRLEFRMVKKDRSVFHVSMEGRRISQNETSALKDDSSGHLFLTLSDITDRKLTEQAIIRAKTQWEQTFDAVPDLIAIIDAKYEIVRVNQALANRLGVTPMACIGKKCCEIFHANQEMSKGCSHQQVIENGHSSQSEGFDRRLNGHFITTISPLDTGESSPPWCIHIAHDITDRKRAEKELMKLRNLESIGILAGGIAHDFNNILTALVGNIELATLSANDKNKYLSFLDKAMAAGFKARDLANRLLTFSKGGNPKNQPVAIGRFLEETAKLCLSGTNINYNLQLPDHSARFIIDEIQMRSALQNIIDNARESMPWGGKLKIKASDVHVDSSSNRQMKPGNYVVINIVDQGTGIRADHLEKIFDPYFTTKQMGVQKGMGLGLAISHSIIKKHHGYIIVQSEEGNGTIVSVYLPCSSMMGALETAAPTRAAVKRERRPKLLIMDDEEILWDVLEQMLQRLECDADFVVSGEDALDLYERSLHNGIPYTALLLDLTIRGGMGAKEVIGKILAIDPDAKAAVFSGYSSDPVFSEYQRFGFVGALKKPFKIEEFKSFVSQVLNEPSRMVSEN
jgi:two-component system cell cycle sensor histidine kinase/response regulator CckA